MKVLPTITICPFPDRRNFEYGKDFQINFGRNNYTLSQGKNILKYKNFTENVYLQAIVTYEFGICLMISTNKGHKQFAESGGYDIFHMIYSLVIPKEDLPTAKVFIASKENSYGTATSYWVEGELMKFDVSKNTFEIGLQLKMAKEIYLIEKGLCQKESFHTCLGSELANQNYSSCPKKCVSFTLPDQDLPICQTTEETSCSLQFIDKVYIMKGLVVLSPAQDVVLFPQYLLPSLLAGEKVQYFQTG